MFISKLIFRRHGDNVSEKIRKDLLKVFRLKGINVTKLNIEEKLNRLNLEVCIKGEVK
ncbi:MAG TPA: hypothetical protein VIO64_15985 [Pseudobacteroides sp.]|uniref:hypothetical protein n=1 Tax=Pseudobacteroides sp. TaxID=1968840 RepID=UPI002F95A03B